MKEFLKKAKLFLYGLGTGIGAVLIIAVTVLVRREQSGKTKLSCESSEELQTKETPNAFTALAETKRQKAEDTVHSTPAHTVAEQYEGVGDAIDAGRSRFASRVKTRVIAAGGRRVDEQHPN